MAAEVITREVIPQHLAIKAMRDSGYKSTDHAVAEIIDNSIQADAKVIEVLIVEHQETVNQNQVWRVCEIAVIDNGKGMDDEVLFKALQFGNGTHLHDRGGIGRFGMGIPNSSISQCRKVDIWTWQAGPDNAIHSALDVEAVENCQMTEIPAPEASTLPAFWRTHSHTASSSESGTVVVWSSLDRVKWKGSKATLDNIEFLIGRIYRKFLLQGTVIRLVVVRNNAIISDQNARINDPLYLSSSSSTPEPFHDRPMFEPFGDTGVETFPITFQGETHQVTLRVSSATDDARVRDDGQNPGSFPHGKHAGRNIGVSIVRAGRELDLDSTWAVRDYRERWWGAEIEFPPSLDEVFGVTNNKQSATHFTQMAAFYNDESRVDDWSRVRDEWDLEDDPRRHLVDLCNRLDTYLRLIRTKIRQQTAGARTKNQQRHEDKSADKATKEFKKREEDGHVAPEDKVPLNRPRVEQDLIGKGLAPQTAREIAEGIEKHGRRVIFVTKDNPESTTFFHPDFLPGVTEIVFNTAHPAYPKLVEMLDPSTVNDDPSELKTRIYSASDTFKMLLSAWARYEMEEHVGPRRERLKEMRQEWGKMAKLFLLDGDVEDFDSGGTQ